MRPNHYAVTGRASTVFVFVILSSYACVLNEKKICIPDLVFDRVIIHNKYKHQARVLWLSADLRVQRRSVTHVNLQGCTLGEGD